MQTKNETSKDDRFWRRLLISHFIILVFYRVNHLGLGERGVGMVEKQGWDARLRKSLFIRYTCALGCDL